MNSATKISSVRHCRPHSDIV